LNARLFDISAEHAVSATHEIHISAQVDVVARLRSRRPNRHLARRIAVGARLFLGSVPYRGRIVHRARDTDA